MTQTAPHILVIDDDERLRDLLSRFLQESGFLVSGAESAAQARNIMRNMQFDLLAPGPFLCNHTNFRIQIFLC